MWAANLLRQCWSVLKAGDSEAPPSPSAHVTKIYKNTTARPIEKADIQTSSAVSIVPHMNEKLSIEILQKIQNNEILCNWHTVRIGMILKASGDTLSLRCPMHTCTLPPLVEKCKCTACHNSESVSDFCTCCNAAKWKRSWSNNSI